jgi:hypothetical protein
VFSTLKRQTSAALLRCYWKSTPLVLFEIDVARAARDTVEQHVNDRPYAASSFLSVAIARTFGTAITGNSKEQMGIFTRG